MASLTEKAGFLTLGNLFNRAATILSGIIVVRWLTQYDLGTFRQVNLIFSSCSMILLLGIPASLYYFMPRAESHEKRGIITHTLLTLTLIGLAGSTTVFLTASFISSAFQNTEIDILLRSYSPYFFFALPASAYFAVMMCVDRVGAAALGGICITLSQILATVIPVLLHCNLLTIFTSMLVTTAIVSIVVVWLCLKVSCRGPLFSPQGFAAKQFKFSLPLGMSQLVSLTGKEIDKFFISSFFSVRDFAIYSVGAIELPITGLIAPAIRSILLPEFSRQFKDNDKKGILETWRESRRKLAIVTFPVISLFFLISHEFLTFLYTDKYAGSVLIFQVYLLVPLLINFESSLILHAKGRTNLLLYASLINVISNVVLNYVLIKWLGMVGPSIATITAEAVGVTTVIFWVCAELEETPWNLFPINEYLRILVSSIIAGMPILLLKNSGVVLSKFGFLSLSAIIYTLILILMYTQIVLTRLDYVLFNKYFHKIPVLNKIINYFMQRGRII